MRVIEYFFGRTTLLCFDTNAYSLIMPTVVLGKLYAGFTAGKRKHENIQNLQTFPATPGTKIAQISQETAER